MVPRISQGAPECRAFKTKFNISSYTQSFVIGRGRHHFFPKRSFNAALSSMASASNCAFSSSSVLQPLGLRDLHPAELRFPFVDAGIVNPRLALLQNPDDLLLRNRLRFMLWVLVMARANVNLDYAQGATSKVKATLELVPRKTGVSTVSALLEFKST